MLVETQDSLQPDGIESHPITSSTSNTASSKASVAKFAKRKFSTQETFILTKEYSDNNDPKKTREDKQESTPLKNPKNKKREKDISLRCAISTLFPCFDQIKEKEYHNALEMG